MSDIYEAINNFCFDGELVSCKEFGSGHINKTYIAKFSDNGVEQRYVVQQVNSDVFKNIEELMSNVFAVTDYLRGVITENGGDPDRETLHYIKTTDGKNYYTDSDGNYYRAYIFVKDSITYDSADSAEIFKKSGAAFGKFQRMLDGFPADKLNETIEHFHDTYWRYENEFLPALSAASSELLSECKDEIAFVENRKDEMPVIEKMLKKGEMPVRVTHNDTKLNNVMFDEKTGECVCVIDLDTVMPGSALYDFGDSIRFGASTAAEDETDLSKVSVNLDYFKAYAEGFLSQAGESLTQAEIDNLAFASKLITLELGMRFLTDYLNGSKYFKTDYEKHNLDRARNQFCLVADMENKMQEMNDIIKHLK